MSIEDKALPETHSRRAFEGIEREHSMCEVLA
jgi:hypothetical protein